MFTIRQVAIAAREALAKYKEEHPDAADANIDIEPLLPTAPKTSNGQPINYGHPWAGPAHVQPALNPYAPLAAPPRPAPGAPGYRELMHQRLRGMQEQMRQDREAQLRADQAVQQAQAQAADLAILHQQYMQQQIAGADGAARAAAAIAEANAARAARARRVRAPPPPMPALDIRQAVRQAQAQMRGTLAI